MVIGMPGGLQDIHKATKTHVLTCDVLLVAGNNVIEVARLNGSSRRVVVRGNLDEPRAIVLYPKKG